MKRQAGFTLIELVMVLIILGILSAVVIAKFTDKAGFQSRGFADQVQTSLRYAQKIAIAQRRYVCVAFTATSVSLSIGTTNACGTPLQSLTGSGNYVVTSPASSIRFIKATHPTRPAAKAKESASMSESPISLDIYGVPF